MGSGSIKGGPALFPHATAAVEFETINGMPTHSESSVVEVETEHDVAVDKTENRSRQERTQEKRNMLRARQAYNGKSL